MAKSKQLERQLARLRELETEPLSPELTAELREALERPSNILAARAAAIVGSRGILELAPDLAVAFHRFLENPLKTDKECLAKTAIAEALDKLSAGEDDVFLLGARHVQMEPVYGGRADTAANLRGICGFALARRGRPEALFELVALLNDPEPAARRAAVQALAHLDRDESELLLRMKALAGDRETDIVGECLRGLMQLDPERSLEFVAAFLDSPDPVLADDAALALGESRAPGAFEVLRRTWEERIVAESRNALLTPIALLRGDEAFAFLVSLVLNENAAAAEHAVAALKLCADDETRQRQVRDAVDTRNDPAVARAHAQEFERTDRNGVLD